MIINIDMILGYDFIEERLFAAIQKVGKTVTDPATKAALKKAKATNTNSFQQPSWFGERIKDLKKGGINGREYKEVGIFGKSFSAVSKAEAMAQFRKRLKKAPVKDVGIFSNSNKIFNPDTYLSEYRTIGADPVVTKTKKLIGPLY